MSTRSNIAIEDPKTKKVKVIYVHSDGYPYGVSKCLVDSYNHYDLAKEIFNHGDASYLGDTLDECSFYGRDWKRDKDPAKTHRDEWMYMLSMRGDIHIEYIYIFKNNQWSISTGKYISPRDCYDSGIGYFTKFESVKDNKEYIKYKDKHEKHAEVKMISQIGALLSEKFPTEDIMMQGAAMKKKTN